MSLGTHSSRRRWWADHGQYITEPVANYGQCPVVLMASMVFVMFAMAFWGVVHLEVSRNVALHLAGTFGRDPTLTF